MRYLDKSAIHAQAVIILRNSKNGMKRTASRLAACNVDKQVEDILSRLKADAWSLDDQTIIQGCAQRLVMDFCQAEINLQK